MSDRASGDACPRLIEVALPIREISAESVRDKSLRHGHISTLHLWWARRPLAASRAVVFASLVPDPDDPRCPEAFRRAVERNLKTHVPAELKYYRRGRETHRDDDPYRPYEGVPDTLRNRLLMFIAKWSLESRAFESGKRRKAPAPKELLDDRSLVKWETSDPENPQGREVLRIARELIQVGVGGQASSLQTDRQDARPPTVLDPFAGGGAIPLEAGRLGCRPIANDYNPVAYLILRATCEFPQKYGKGGWRAGFQPAKDRSGRLSSAPSLEPVTTESLFDHSLLKATRRTLPHWELDGRIYYITFSAWDRWELPEAAREIILDAVLHWNGSRLRVHQVVVMPDHVHALLEPINGHELSKTLHSIKSFSANKVNELLGRRGHLWQPESFDRIVRDEKDYLEKWEYIQNNPVKDGLARKASEYLWLYEDYVVKRCSLEGCPPTWVPNVLVHDVEMWANWILERAREKIGHLYPLGKDGRPVVDYLWARTAPCSNPSCRGEIPLLRSLLVCNKKDKKVALTLEVDKAGKSVRFGIAKGKDIRVTDGTMQNRGNVQCPYCDQVTPVADLRTAGLAGKMGERMVAVIVEGKSGKDYRPVEEADLAAFHQAASINAERPSELILAEVTSSDKHVSHRGQFTTYMYGMKTWGSLFNPRQLVAMQTFVECLHEALEEMEVGGQAPSLHNDSLEGCPPTITDKEYRKAVGIYLGLWLSRNAMRMTSMGRLDTTRETVQSPFDKQAIPMKWDYVETNPFSDVTGGVKGQLEWIIHYMNHESEIRKAANVFHGDGAQIQLTDHSVDVVVTDPPYFDAIAYSDLSDFFYVWLKRALGEVVPEVLITPLTPKGDEATALKHRHDGDAEKADRHFTTKLAQVMAEAKRVTKPHGIITVMFAHQSTKAWTALVNALFESGLTVDATWPIDTELKNRAIALGTSALESSIIVACRPRIAGSAASFKPVRKEIEQVVQRSVKRFWSYGFRGADLIVACYGPSGAALGSIRTRRSSMRSTGACFSGRKRSGHTW